MFVPLYVSSSCRLYITRRVSPGRGNFEGLWRAGIQQFIAADDTRTRYEEIPPRWSHPCRVLADEAPLHVLGSADGGAEIHVNLVPPPPAQ